MSSSKYVEESPDDLLLNAEKDIIVIKRLMQGNYYPPDLMYSNICFHATQAVEKQLKSYIITNGKKAPKIHNLNDLLFIAISIDESFSKIKDECGRLNQFTSMVRYDGGMTITKADITIVNKCLSKIINFPLVESMRLLIIKKYNINFSIKTEDVKPSSGKANISKDSNSKRKNNDTIIER
jgi:HEPN domain-containing protein